ncbi:unnamed protein product [Amoebophrya sp. A25]|nr:unnamed protein product [Amoebophrya sp. A25]|eukprot:GSA25T00005491001.1
MLKVEPLASHPAFSSNKTGASGKDKSSNAERLFAFLRITDINVHKDQEKNTRHGGNSLAGLFVIGSKLGHSCAANCTWTFTPQRRLRYVAVRPILKGEMLTFSYFGDGLNVCGGTMERRLELRKLQFLCACFRCMQGLDFSRGVKCSKCGSERAFLVSRRKKPLSKEDLAKCGKRNDERDDEAQFPFLEAQMDDVPDLADTDFYCGMKFGPDTVTKKSASSATETTSEGVSDSVVDVYFCTSCGYKEQQLTQELKKKEDFLIKSVPSLLDHNSPKGTLPEIVEELERKEAYLGELEQSFGRFHYAWALGCFAWLQSVLALVMRVNRVDLDIALVVSRCVALEEVSRVCFRDCWVQRLRLLGLVAHVQKTLKLFPAQHGGGSSSSSSGVQQLSPLPNLNPLGCKEGANVVKRLLRHADKFEHLNIFQYDVEEDDRMAQGPLQRISYSKPAIESISSELLEGDWRPVVLAGA